MKIFSTRSSISLKKIENLMHFVIPVMKNEQKTFNATIRRNRENKENTVSWD